MRLRSFTAAALMSLMMGSMVLVGCAKHEESGRETAAATRAEDAARRAEAAASRCEAAAQRAETASERAERSFRHGVRK